MWTVERISKVSEFESVRSDWNRLAANHRMRSADWSDFWWSSLSGVCVPYLLVVRQSQDVRGIFPLALEHTALRGRRLLLMGSGKACGDNLGILADSGYEDELVRELSHWLLEARSEDAWDQLDFDGVQPSDPLMSKFQQQIEKEHHLLVEQRASESCWAIDLKGGMDGFVGSLSKRTRRIFKNQLLANYIQTGCARLKQADSLVNAHAILEMTAAFHQARWEDRNIDGCFGTVGFNGFLKRLIDRWWPQGIAYVATLELDEQPVAGAIGFWGPDELALYLVGMDIAAQEHRPGLLLSVESIRCAIENGKKHFNFLRGDEGYKARLGAHPTTQQRWVATSPRWIPQMRKLALSKGVEVRDWFRRKVKTPVPIETTPSNADANSSMDNATI